MSDVGFANIPAQAEKKKAKKGFTFSLMCLGEKGCGKSTFISSLFAKDLDFEGQYENYTQVKKRLELTKNRVEPDVSVHTFTEEIVEKQVKLKLTVIEVPGFGDAICNEKAWVQPYEYVTKKFDEFLEQENRVKRTARVDERVHALVYFISPTNRGLSTLDIDAISKLHEVVNVIPVIAKADTLSAEECLALKRTIREDFEKHNLQTFRLPVDSEDEDEVEVIADIYSQHPFALVSSTDLVDSPVSGKKVFGRKYPWGVVEMENDLHCDFNALKNLLVRERLHDLKESTIDLYENYRSVKLSTETED